MPGVSRVGPAFRFNSTAPICHAHAEGRHAKMDEEEALTDAQKKMTASLSTEESRADQRFRHSPFLIFAILLPVLGLALLLFVLFLPMMMCSGASTVAMLACALMALVQSGQLGA